MICMICRRVEIKISEEYLGNMVHGEGDNSQVTTLQVADHVLQDYLDWLKTKAYHNPKSQSKRVSESNWFILTFGKASLEYRVRYSKKFFIRILQLWSIPHQKSRRSQNL